MELGLTKLAHRFSIKTHPEVYDPAEDTLLLANNLTARKDDKILEIGVGSGYVSLMASRNAKIVVGTDLNIHAAKLAKLNAKLNNIPNVDFVFGDLFGPIGERFDLIVINPPYLPETGGIEPRHIDLSWNGGKDGRRVIDKFLEDVSKYLDTNGRILMVQSSISDNNKTMKILVAQGFEVRIIAEEKLFFETLFLIEAKPSSGHPQRAHQL